MTDLLEAVRNLLSWWKNEGNRGFAYSQVQHLIDDLEQAAQGIDVFRFKNPEDLIDRLVKFRNDLLRDNVLEPDNETEVHYVTLTSIISQARDTLREKEKPSEVEMRAQATGFLQKMGTFPTLIDSFVNDDQGLGKVIQLVEGPGMGRAGYGFPGAMLEVWENWEEPGDDEPGMDAARREQAVYDEVHHETPVSPGDADKPPVEFVTYCKAKECKVTVPFSTNKEDGYCEEHKAEVCGGCGKIHDEEGDEGGLTENLKGAGFHEITGDVATELLNKIMDGKLPDGLKVEGFELGGDEDGDGDEDEVEQQHEEQMKRAVVRNPGRFLVQTSLQVERNRLAIDGIRKTNVEVMDALKDVQTYFGQDDNIPDRLKDVEANHVRAAEEREHMNGRLRAMEHEVSKEAIPRLIEAEAVVSAMTDAWERHEGEHKSLDVPALLEKVKKVAAVISGVKENFDTYREERKGQVATHDEELTRLSSLANTDGIRLNRLEANQTSAAEERVVTAGRVDHLFDRTRPYTERLIAHNEKLARLTSDLTPLKGMVDGHVTNLADKQNLLERLAERIQTLENWTTAHRSAERPHGLAAEEVESEDSG